MARFVLFGRKIDDDIHSSRCPPLVMIWLWRLTLRINDSFIVSIIRSSVAHSFAMTTYIYFSYFTEEKKHTHLLLRISCHRYFLPFFSYRLQFKSHKHTYGRAYWSIWMKNILNEKRKTWHNFPHQMS